MIRKLAFALSLLGMSFAGLVHALGLGEANIKSSLNQPLRAEIELVSVKGLEEAEILPGLATREEFVRAGVDRVYFLSDIRFKVEPDDNGNLVVVLTTNKPVREPFLNFLVEVIWPSGRLLREYSLLIDPPLFAEEIVKPVATPVIRRVESGGGNNGDSVAMPVVKTSVAKASPTTVSQSASYGPTTARDTLWEIALKARPNRSVSPQQVMLAIQDLNPEAFIKNNINKLKTGRVLRLPTLDQMKARSAGQAINEVISQNEALQAKKAKPMVSAAKVAPVKVKAPAVAQGGDELKLVVANDASSSSSSANSGTSEFGSGSGEATDAELALTLEKLDKSSIENQELSGRLKDLEGQLETLQRLLTLKNDQLASIQEQARAADYAKQLSEQENESGQNTVSLDDKLAVEGSSDAVASKDENVAELDKSEPAAVDAEKQATEEVTKESTPPQGQSLIEMILGNPLYLALVGAGLVVLLIILRAISKSNAQREQDAHVQTSDSADEEAVENPTSEVAGSFEEDTFAETESEEVYESGGEDGDYESANATPPEDHDESEDVIAEADVYIAYGRLDQAASVLEQGVSAEPIRTDYRLKLLEVYRDSNDASAFDKQLSELDAIQDSEAMEKALEIKAGFSSDDTTDSAPDSFDEADSGEKDRDDETSNGAIEYEPTTAEELVDSQEADAGSVDSDDALDVSSELGDEPEPDNSFDFESVTIENDDLDVDLSSEDLDLDLDIDLELDQVDDESSEVSLSSVADSDDETLVSDASILDLDEGEELEREADGLALDLGDLDLSEELDQESEISLPDDLSLSDELTGLEDPVEEDSSDGSNDSPGESSGETSATESEQAEHVVSDDILDEAVEALGDADDFEPELAEGEDFDFLDGADEASTKLDLARAYIDMGDLDGAKDILQEVEKEGSSEQQTEAKQLIESLDG